LQDFTLHIRPVQVSEVTPSWEYPHMSGTERLADPFDVFPRRNEIIRVREVPDFGIASESSGDRAQITLRHEFLSRSDAVQSIPHVRQHEGVQILLKGVATDLCVGRFPMKEIAWSL